MGQGKCIMKKLNLVLQNNEGTKRNGQIVNETSLECISAFSQKHGS
jgi:hypothetical protein